MASERQHRFQAQVLVHLDAGYGLARWLLHDEQRAADATQDACLRAWRHFDGLFGDSAKAWFLTIVRHACHDAFNAGRDRAAREEAAAELPDPPDLDGEGHVRTPEWHAERAAQVRLVHDALAQLDVIHREVIVLREFEEMSYREIGTVVGVPIGTVMSRLSRGRDELAALLGARRTRRTA